MISSTENAANQAIFQLQLNLDQAIKYVMRNANVSAKQAAAVVRSVMTFHVKETVKR